MEYALRAVAYSLSNSIPVVLILVLMEYALRAGVISMNEETPLVS